MKGYIIKDEVKLWYLPGSSTAEGSQPVTIQNLAGAIFGSGLPVGSKVPGADN